MTITSGNALRNGRKRSLLSIITAAFRLNITDRTLKRYENDEVKEKDPQIFLSAMILYNDINIGLAYLEENPVFKYLFGSIRITDTLRAATMYVAESDGDQSLQPILRWGLNDGNEPLLDLIVKKIRNSMNAAIDLYFNIRQKDGFAY